ncbi:MAG TPA: tetratricopeptide repeat protein [Candidatus Dormibacteraeota bacterium]|nr:tetratricopeptide repeat protein [Candidatus Dormibacteraeota bacterium]
MESIRGFRRDTYVEMLGSAVIHHQGCLAYHRSPRALSPKSVIISNMSREPACFSRLLILAGALSLATCAVAAGPVGEDSHLQDALEVVDGDHADLCPGTASREEFEATMTRLADEVRGDLGPDASGSVSVEALNRRIFGPAGVHASTDLKNPCNLLPSRVLERKQGYCVGIAALYLLIAERLDLPIYAVATPSHVFLRHDDGVTRINIETLQGGVNIPDEQYIREQKIPEESIRRGVFMCNLTTDEFLAQVHNNLGVIYSERKNYDAAAREYDSALDLDPHLPAALYNWGNDLLREGQYRRAVWRFSKALRLFPTDVWALNNRGLAYLKMEKREKALWDFEAAIKVDPGFEQARRNLDGIRPLQ